VKILITGATGFLGGRLQRYWSEQGHIVTGTGRGAPFALAENMDEQGLRRALAGHDAVVHCAYDSQASVAVNVAGTKSICSAAEVSGAPWQMLLGSYAARPAAVARYGQIKYELERYFLDRGHTVVRPGLVVGDGGIFRRNMDAIVRAPVIPLLDGGKDPVPVIAIDDFVSAMDVLLEQRARGVFNLFNRDLVTMRVLVDTIARMAGRRPWRVAVPLKPALWLVETATKLGIRLPFGTDNIRSLKQSLPGVYESDLEALVPMPMTFEAMVEGLRQYL
jgi:NADH dehydrogenase